MLLFTFKAPTFHQSPLFTLRGLHRPLAAVNDVALKNTLHPLHQRTTEHYKRRQSQLNIYTVVGLTVHKSSCVRDRIRRRIREACRLALADAGYRLDGTPIPRHPQPPQPPPPPSPQPVETVVKDETGEILYVLHSPLRPPPPPPPPPLPPLPLRLRGRSLLGTIIVYPKYEVVSADWKVLAGETKQAIDRWLMARTQERPQQERDGRHGKGRGERRGERQEREERPREQQQQERERPRDWQRGKREGPRKQGKWEGQSETLVKERREEPSKGRSRDDDRQRRQDSGSSGDGNGKTNRFIPLVPRGQGGRDAQRKPARDRYEREPSWKSYRGGVI